jgi:hypothetical protein
MSAGEELNELREHAEEAKERKGLAPVSLTMAVVAVLVATISLLGHRAHTEEILLQNQTTDKWAYYQAKNLRLNNLQALNKVMSALEGKNEKAEQVQKDFEADIERYTEDKNKAQEEGHELEAELRHETQREPLRSRRGVSRDRPGGDFDHLVDGTQILLGNGNGICRRRYRDRGYRFVPALRQFR